jgi:hypothetical protein
LADKALNIGIIDIIVVTSKPFIYRWILTLGFDWPVHL